MVINILNKLRKCKFSYSCFHIKFLARYTTSVCAYPVLLLNFILGLFLPNRVFIKTAILKVLPDEFKLTQRHDTDKISELVQDTYPCFILSEKGKAVKLWTNNQVGTSALDEMEEFFETN